MSCSAAMNQPFGKKAASFILTSSVWGLQNPQGGGLCPQEIPNDQVVDVYVSWWPEMRQVDGMLLICHCLTVIYSTQILGQSQPPRKTIFSILNLLKMIRVQKIFSNTMIQGVSRIKWITLPKTNMDTQNDGLEKVTPFKHGISWYLC